MGQAGIVEIVDLSDLGKEAADAEVDKILNDSGRMRKGVDVFVFKFNSERKKQVVSAISKVVEDDNKVSALLQSMRTLRVESGVITLNTDKQESILVKLKEVCDSAPVPKDMALSDYFTKVVEGVPYAVDIVPQSKLDPLFEAVYKWVRFLTLLFVNALDFP